MKDFYLTIVLTTKQKISVPICRIRSSSTFHPLFSWTFFLSKTLHKSSVIIIFILGNHRTVELQYFGSSYKKRESLLKTKIIQTDFHIYENHSSSTWTPKRIGNPRCGVSQKTKMTFKFKTTGLTVKETFSWTQEITKEKTRENDKFPYWIPI